MVLKAGIAYFALAFTAGFLLGALRVLLLVPRFGARISELMEAPVMLVVTVIAARWVIAHFLLARVFALRLLVGLVALAILIAAEIGTAVILQHQTIAEYIHGRDPVSGVVYAGLLAAFLLMPSILMLSGERAP